MLQKITQINKNVSPDAYNCTKQRQQLPKTALLQKLLFESSLFFLSCATS